MKHQPAWRIPRTTITTPGRHVVVMAIRWSSAVGPRSAAKALAWELHHLPQNDRLAALAAIRQAFAAGASTASAGAVSVELVRLGLDVLSLEAELGTL